MVNKKNTVDAGNQFHSFMKGWKDGASSRAMDPKATEHENPLIRAAYDAGYGKARKDLNAVAEEAAKTYGYTISVLRLMEAS